jgi:hypothetical protein
MLYFYFKISGFDVGREDEKARPGRALPTFMA